MGYWQSKVLPTIKKVFDKKGVKKAAAAEACKSFDDAKEEYNKELEEKKTELQPKVIEIYDASSAEIKSLVKEPKDVGLKKHSVGVEKFLDELRKIEFPGSKQVYEASSKLGPALLPGPIFYVFGKVSTIIVTEEEIKETTVEETSGTKDKEKVIVVEEEKKEEVVLQDDKTEPSPATTEEPPKVEETAAAELPKL